MAEKLKVLVVCPAKHGLPWYFLEPMMKLQKLDHPKYDFEFSVEAGNNAINISRNILVCNAMESPKNYWKVVQIDSDALWSVEQLIQLVDHPEDIVAAPYCRKSGGPVSWLCVRTPGTDTREDGMMQCDFMGTHFFSVSISALKTMRDMLPETEFEYDDKDGENKRKVMSELFPIGLVGPNSYRGRLQRIKKVIGMELSKVTATPESRAQFNRAKLGEIEKILTETHPQKSRMLGEDYHFNFLARKCGFKLWADLKAGPVHHVGNIAYPVDPKATSTPTEFPSHDLDLDQW